MSNICWFRLLKCEDLQLFSAKIKQSLGFGLLAGQNKPFLRCHFRLWEVVTRIFWYKYTKYCIYNHTHTHQTRLCVIVVIWDSDISPLTKHLHHLPVLQRADSKNRLIKRKKKKEKVSCSSTVNQKGNPSLQCKWAPVSRWNGLLSSASEVSQVYSGIALWVTRSKPTAWKTPPPLRGNSGVQSVPLCFRRKMT